jgi:hypothetical protein
VAAGSAAKRVEDRPRVLNTTARRFMKYLHVKKIKIFSEFPRLHNKKRDYISYF